MSLSPSQRVTLIKEVAVRLANEEWPFIDVTLKQFSLPWTEQWSGTKDAYILEMIDEAPDQTLIDLAQHVGFKIDRASPPHVEPPFWRNGMLRVFVTHLAANRAFAGTLQEALLRFGICCFVAHNDIEPTAEWQAELEAALATCEALVALLNPEFHESNWTDQEIGFAMGRGVPVFAVHLGQVPYGFIGRFQAFNGMGKTPVALAQELFDAYRKNKQTQQRMGEVLVGLSEQSGSFADAKARIGYLEDLVSWDPAFPARIRLAAKTNSQISNSFGVPRRVTALASRWERSGG
jgi:hypothetical protein